jgi:hypothetical protein
MPEKCFLATGAADPFGRAVAVLRQAERREDGADSPSEVGERIYALPCLAVEAAESPLLPFGREKVADRPVEGGPEDCKTT